MAQTCTWAYNSWELENNLSAEVFNEYTESEKKLYIYKLFNLIRA